MLVHCGEKQAKNFKQVKDRVTLLGCCNASGTCKLPLAFIHKSARPRCFKNMEMSALPVCYLSQPKAWMNATLFEGWFHKNFVPHVKKFCQDQGIEYKVLLLLDNAPAHPSPEKLTSCDGKVTTMFLPPNTTSILQPLDQGLLEALKRRYKKCLLRHIVLENSASSLTVPDIVKGLTIKDAVYWVSQAWEDVSPITIKKSWKKLFPSSDADDNSSDAEEVASVIPHNHRNSWCMRSGHTGYMMGQQNFQGTHNCMATLDPALSVYLLLPWLYKSSFGGSTVGFWRCHEFGCIQFDFVCVPAISWSVPSSYPDLQSTNLIEVRRSIWIWCSAMKPTWAT